VALQADVMTIYAVSMDCIDWGGFFRGDFSHEK
jgi:hypothetical protein